MLMVEVAILGILAAIAIPTFLGQREGAQDRNAQSSIRNAMTVSRAAAANTDDGNYPSNIQAVLDVDEPSLDFVDAGASTDPAQVSVHLEDDTTLVLAAQSTSGTCWFAVSDLEAQSTYGASEKGEDCDLTNDGSLDGTSGEYNIAELDATSFADAGQDANRVTPTARSPDLPKGLNPRRAPEKGGSPSL